MKIHPFISALTALTCPAWASDIELVTVTLDNSVATGKSWHAAGFSFTLNSSRLNTDPCSVGPADFDDTYALSRLSFKWGTSQQETEFSTGGFALVNAAGEVIYYDGQTLNFDAGQDCEIGLTTTLNIDPNTRYSLMFKVRFLPLLFCLVLLICL